MKDGSSILDVRACKGVPVFLVREVIVMTILCKLMSRSRFRDPSYMQLCPIVADLRRRQLLCAIPHPRRLHVRVEEADSASRNKSMSSLRWEKWESSELFHGRGGTTLGVSDRVCSSSRRWDAKTSNKGT